jgi:hypothetical protein
LIGSLLSNCVDTVVWTAATPTKVLPALKMLLTIGTTDFNSRLTAPLLPCNQRTINLNENARLQSVINEAM